MLECREYITIENCETLSSSCGWLTIDTTTYSLGRDLHYVMLLELMRAWTTATCLDHPQPAVPFHRCAKRCF